MPKHGPRLGSRKHTRDCLPKRFKPSLNPTEVVVLPSPAGVGVIAVTRINLPFGRLFSEATKSWDNFALVGP